MYQFFVEDENIDGGLVRITGSDVNHIKNVLRMKCGEVVRVSNASEQAFFCRIEEIRPGEVLARIEEADALGTEFSHRVYLFQGLPKSDRMELVVQKAVELGVYEIIPVMMKNCVAKLEASKVEGRLRRWQAIAESAAKQSKRTVIPRVHEPVSWNEALQMAGRLDVTLVPYENERGLEHTREVLSCIAENASIGVMIGPEGGYSGEEIGSVPYTMHRISLGRRILRTETAGPAVLAMLLYALDV